MNSKPPYGMAASGHPDGADTDLEDLSDEIAVDSSQDVTVEASEEATLEVAEEDYGSQIATPLPEPAAMLTPPPNLGRRGNPTLMGLPLPSLPLPGVTAAPPASRSDPGDLLGDEDDDEVTVMARPSVTDDEEEATKVEPAETALHAAATKGHDELSSALSTQASVERERALRKSFPPSLDMPLSPASYSGAEFEDPEDDDNIEVSGETPGAISVEDDSVATSTYAADQGDQEEPSSELEAVLAPRRPPTPLGSPFLGSPSLGRPEGVLSGRPEGFGAVRLPTPSPGFGLSLPAPGPAPAPVNSPFSARVAPAGSPYSGSARTSSAAIPTLQIPAPSGTATTAATTGATGLFSKVQLPVGGWVGAGLALFVGGLVIGAKFLAPHAPAPIVVTAAPAPSAPVVQPVAAAPAAEPAPMAAAPSAPTAAATPPPAAPTPPPAAAVPAVAPATAPVAAETPPPSDEAAAKAAAKPAIKRAARPAHKATSIASAGSNGPSPKPRAKVAKGWVDPFAE